MSDCHNQGGKSGSDFGRIRFWARVRRFRVEFHRRLYLESSAHCLYRLDHFLPLLTTSYA